MICRPVFATLCMFILVTSVAAVGQKGHEELPSEWADINVLDQGSNVSVWLVAKNRAAIPVHLVNCRENNTVPAGGNITLRLAGLSGFWIVPNGLDWDCHTGPFDLYFIAVSLIGPELFASVGFGFSGSFDTATTNASVDNPDAPVQVGTIASASMNKTNAAVYLGHIGGVSVAAGPPTAIALAGCWAASCGENQNLTSMPDAFNLAVLGHQALLLSSRYRHPNRWHPRRRNPWHRRHWHRHHYRRHPYRCRWWCAASCWC